MFVWTRMYVHMCVRVHISVIVDQWRSEDTAEVSSLPSAYRNSGPKPGYQA